MKEAIGIAFCGDEMHVAHLLRRDDGIALQDVQKLKLSVPLTTPGRRAALGYSEAAQQLIPSKDFKAIFTMLQPFAAAKSRIALHPLSDAIQYEMLTPAQRTQVLTYTDPATADQQTLLPVSAENILALRIASRNLTLELLQDVSSFCEGRLLFSLLDTPELVLAGLARQQLSEQTTDISALIHISASCSRISLLQGRRLVYVSPLLPCEVSDAPLHMLARKLILAQDLAGLASVDRIYLSGRARSMDARAFLGQQFHHAAVSYLSPQLAARRGMSDEALSEFAVSIALAQKQLQPRSSAFYNNNLMPEEVLHSQKFLRLDPVSLSLLASTLILALFFIWHIFDLQGAIHLQMLKNRSQLNSMQLTMERAAEARAIQSEQLDLKLEAGFIDSLAAGHDAPIRLLKHLGSALSKQSGTWIEQLNFDRNRFSFRGKTRHSAAIMRIADMLPFAELGAQHWPQGANGHPRFEFSGSLDAIPIPPVPPAKNPLLMAETKQQPVQKLPVRKSKTKQSAQPRPVKRQVSGRFTVNAGQYSSIKDARASAAKFRDRGLDASIYTASDPDDDTRTYAVLIGLYTTETDAHRMLSRLQANGLGIGRVMHVPQDHKLPLPAPAAKQEFGIEVLLTTTRADAEKVVTYFRRRGKQALLRHEMSAGQFRVIVGAYASRRKAEDTVQKLRKYAAHFEVVPLAESLLNEFAAQ